MQEMIEEDRKDVYRKLEAASGIVNSEMQMILDEVMKELCSH